MTKDEILGKLSEMSRSVHSSLREMEHLDKRRNSRQAIRNVKICSFIAERNGTFRRIRWFLGWRKGDFISFCRGKCGKRLHKLDFDFHHNCDTFLFCKPDDNSHYLSTTKT